MCDTDRDNDGVDNESDNCSIALWQILINLIAMAMMLEIDACPCNNDIDATDFRGIQNISLENYSYLYLLK